MTHVLTRRLVALTALTLALPTPAMAQQAIAAKSVNVRAGPGRDYPLVAQVGPGAPLAVQGCIQNYSWCDVIVPGNNRGWVYAGNISYLYQNNEVPLIQYGSVIGLPIVGFVLGSYWGDYYRNRPFYGDRDRWAQRPGYGGPPPGFARPGPGGWAPRGSQGGVRPPIDRRPEMQPGGGRPVGIDRRNGPPVHSQPGGRLDRGGGRGPGPGGQRGPGPGGNHGGPGGGGHGGGGRPGR